ncbi:MAG: DUF1624 domain-containing protein [Parasporobacterium sp.]|nr:DUF1624 domain-containing protein [Parasporobacterium sp.]
MEQSNERQYNLDLLKAFAIVCMVICHAVLMLGQYRPESGNEFWYIFADNIIGAYVVAAHGFMFAMGVGMVYSRKNRPADQIRRGVSLLILAYVLNFFRYGMYFMAEGLITGTFAERAMGSLFGGDILHFAGLAFIVTGILKQLKLKESTILFIALILSMIGTMAASVDTHNAVWNIIVGLFVFTPNHASTFCFCSWYLFVAVGLVFGKILKETPDKDSFYKKLLIISGILTAIYVAATFACGMFFLSKDKAFYDASPLEALGLLSIDFFVLSLFHFLLKKVDASKFRRSIEMSKNINSIYCIHWCIVGPIEFFFCYLLKWVPGYLEMYAIGFALLFISFFLARLYKTKKAKFMERHA